MSTVIVHAQLVSQTLDVLQLAGRREIECVVLWLGKRGDETISVTLVWIPQQFAGRGFFEIPEQAMESLFCELRAQRLMIVAQVHTHPKEAFHSLADDEWAIVRHVGALSLVLPHFALKTTLASFNRDAALFTLSVQNEWLQVEGAEIDQRYRIIP